MLGVIRTCLVVSSVRFDFFEFLSTDFAAVRSHQAEIIIDKRLIQGRTNVTRVRVEPRLCDQGRRKTMPLPLGHAAE